MVAVRVMVCTLSGTVRCRLVPLKQYEAAKNNGVALAECVMALPVHIDAFAPPMATTPVGEVRLIPEVSTEVRLPWHPQHMAVIANAHEHPGLRSKYCPRTCLQKCLGALQARYGFDLKVGFEIEFILLDPSKGTPASTTNTCTLPPPVDRSKYSTARALDQSSDFCDELITCLEQMDIEVLLIHGETAHGHFEVVTGPYDALTAADKLILTRAAIMGVAQKSGLEASFLPKMALADPGNGCHCHFSLTKNGENAMGGMDPGSLTSEAASFLAGILKHLEAVCCFVSPSVNSFARFMSNYWSGAYKIIGVSNKEAPLRLVFPCAEGVGSTNCELKTFDSTANPYIGLGALVMAGICGLQYGLSLPEFVNVAPEAVAEKLDLTLMPKTLEAAISAFEKDQIFGMQFRNVAGKDFIDEFIAVRKVENEYFSGKDFESQVLELYASY